MAELYELSIHEAGELLRQGSISAVELTQSHLDRIRAVDDEVKAFITVTDELALEQAEEADRRLQSGAGLTPLTGIPLAIKDVIATKGVVTTCGSRMLENYIPPFNATVMEKLNAAGAVMLGKTNMDEFAMGSSTEHSYFFPTHNPWDLSRAPGGSSGGSAAAVAAGMAMGALGSDTGGSIRQPAALCNVVGLKPTYGRVSRFGLVAFASSLDQIGPFTRSARDAALLLQEIAGPDRRDATSSPVPVPDYSAALSGTISGLRIGVPEEYWVEGTQPGVIKDVRADIERLRELGAEVGPISLPHTKYAVAAYYKQAQKVRALITQDFERAFEHFDVLVSPTSPTVAFKLGEIADPYQMYLLDIFTIPANLAGIPGISIPGGFSQGLPVGLQLLGNFFTEDLLLRVADAFGQVTDYAKQWPDLSTVKQG